MAIRGHFGQYHNALYLLCLISSLQSHSAKRYLNVQRPENFNGRPAMFRSAIFALRLTSANFVMKTLTSDKASYESV